MRMMLTTLPRSTPHSAVVVLLSKEIVHSPPLAPRLEYLPSTAFEVLKASLLGQGFCSHVVQGFLFSFYNIDKIFKQNQCDVRKHF